MVKLGGRHRRAALSHVGIGVVMLTGDNAHIAPTIGGVTRVMP
jgi:high-affinity K+ transport system ATPase subunit B